MACESFDEEICELPFGSDMLVVLASMTLYCQCRVCWLSVRADQSYPNHKLCYYCFCDRAILQASE